MSPTRMQVQRGVKTRRGTPPARPSLPKAPVRDGDRACRVEGGGCGSCVLVNSSYEPALQAKFSKGLRFLESANLLGTARVLGANEAPRRLGYRTLVKVAVRPKASLSRDPSMDRFAIGLFEPGTHVVMDEAEHCPIHAPALRGLLRDLRRALNESPLQPWSEASGEGDVRYIVARSSHMTNEIMLTVVVRDASAKLNLQRIFSRLKREGHKLASTHMNVHAGAGNAIFGEVTQRLSGNDRLRERLCDLNFEIGPTAFFQVNPWQAAMMYRRVEQLAGLAGPGGVAWDLYCGIGQISMMLARQGFRVFGVEENPAAVEDAQLNARRNALEERTTFLAAKVEDSETAFPAWSRKPEVIVVNPSRRGLHESARAHLAHVLRQNPDTRLIYVSCEVETMARDLAAMRHAGFRLRQVEAFDMFAHTDNLEWLAVMTS
jgi:23S rRNA (uracil1939-C5)-methyltransferase